MYANRTSPRFLLALFILQFVLHTIASPVWRHEVEGFDTQLERRQNPTVAVTGINAFGVQPRLEIRQLESNSDQWNIFLLGMKRFQETDQSDMISYYQIAGIHGRPYKPWGDVPPAPGVSGPGYCMHLLNLFLAWHRPYLALFEQTLYEHIIDAVNEFPPGARRQRYAAAALSWRFPYWDWAARPPAGQGVYPSSMQSPTVTVTMPNGTNTIRNPLYNYEFHPASTDDFYYDPFASWDETKRFPTSWEHDAISQNELLGPVFDNSRVSFQDRLYNLFTGYDNFTEFGNEAWLNTAVSNADSLESLHDVIHGILGSNGHMTYLDYSAYDPSFWLHHAMMDRCFALWQALYPNSYVEPMDAIEGTYTINIGDRKDVNSALEPFFSNSNRDYWTAASARSTRAFGYTYPELTGNADVSKVKEAINTLYGNSAGSSGLSRRTIPGAVSAIQTNTIPDEVVNGKHRQYVANIRSQKFALDGTYAIYVFIGDFDDTPSAWATSPNLVGTHAVFAALPSVGAEKSSKPAIPVTGTIPLTSMLLAKAQAGELGSMAPEKVGEYLSANLHWRVATFHGSETAAEDVEDLRVTVVTAKVEPASSSDEFPEWSSFTELTSITRGKPGGCD